MRIGVDTGGTFTDCVVVEGGAVKILKVFSTPDDAARGIAQGVRQLARTGKTAALEIVHGTTIGTNSLLERRGAKVALVTTAGFEDLLEIGRQNRPSLYDLNVLRDPPLVTSALRFGVNERTAADGKILQKPSPAELKRLRAQIQKSGAESIAVCLLFSFANPAHEMEIARALIGLRLPVSVSHEILREFREFERVSSTTINAFLAPRMGAYLFNLGRVFADRSRHSRVEKRDSRDIPLRRTSARVYVMQSSGGITTAERAAREPVRTILSGPAGGVVAAASLAKRIGIDRIISFDMGGTSTDVCLIEGQPRTTNETILGGLPVAVPVLDVHSVGAGGGSLARIDSGGALRVGPGSAGAVPGPICYGRGGTQPTVTDAHLILGRLDPDYFLGGTFKLDASDVEHRFAEFIRRAHSAIANPVALACGIVAVTNANMERALRLISVERGYDPRDFSLICFGGAGGLHAADLARSLSLKQVVVPANPGAFSALGILTSDIVKDASHSALLRVPEQYGKQQVMFRKFIRNLRERFQRLESRAHAELQREGFNGQRAKSDLRLDIRYLGQAYELSVPFTSDFPARFHREHEKAYGYSRAGRPIEVVNLRVRLAIPTPKPRARHHAATPHRPLARPLLNRKPVWFGQRLWNTPLYDRDQLAHGTTFRGPVVVIEYSSTTIVPPDFVACVDKLGNLVLSQNAR